MTIRWQSMFPLGTALSAALCLSAAYAEVRLPNMYGDHMVLQRDRPVPVRGTGAFGEEVAVTLAPESGDGRWTRTTRVGADGRWLVTLPPRPAGGPHTLTVQGQNRLVLRDLLFGEVWLASGQSNMAIPVMGAQDAAAEIAAADHPHLRFFIGSAASARFQPQEDLVAGLWQRCSPKSVGSVSAVSYFFGRALQQDLQIPVGLVIAALGSSAAEPWMDLGGLAAEPELAALHADCLKQVAAQPPAADDHGWAAPAFDDAAWKTMPVPGYWEQHDKGMAELDGVVWFRREATIPAAWAGKELTLRLGPIDDGDATYFNGARVGGMDLTTPDVWTQARRYVIPGEQARSGRAIIAIRVTDQFGGGGLVGAPDQYSLAPTAAPAEALSLAGDWRFAVAERWPSHLRTTSLYNGMIHPWTAFPIAGVIWYQGESNTGQPARYRWILRGLITGWRGAWRQETMPFLVVQLPNFNGDSHWAEFREAQALAVRSTPHTGLAVTIGLGEADSVHPRNKQDVGLRLGRLALAKVYGRPVLASGPVCDGATVEESGIRLRFAHVGEGLVAGGDRLQGFTIAGADRRFVPAEAAIEQDTVVVRSPEVLKPFYVRYAWADNPVATLGNRDGLPAAPFRTEGATVIPPPGG